MPATVKRGQISTVTDTTNIKLDIADAIDFLSPTDVPLLDAIGKDSLHTPCTQILHEWLEDELEARSGTLLNAYVAGSGTMTLAANQGTYLVPDDIIRSENIVFRVLSGPPDSDTLTVSVLAGTDAAIAAAKTWRKIAHAAQQGGVARSDSKKTVLTKPYNYPQIFKDWIVVSGTMEVISRYGYVSERAYQEEKLLKRLAIDMEQALVYGARSYNAGPPVKATMGGLWDYVRLAGVTNSWASVINMADAQVTETKVNDVLAAVWALGGSVDCVLVNSFNKRVISTWATPRIRTERSERTAGGFVTYYESDFGTIDILLDRWVDGSDLIFLKKSEVGIGPLVNRQFSSREVPSSLDGTWYEILGEYTQEVHKPSITHGWIYNTSTS